MGVSYREEIRRRQKGTGKTTSSRQQVRLQDKRTRDRKEYFRKPHSVRAFQEKAAISSQVRMF